VHTTLTCAACGKGHDIDRLQNLCLICQQPLLVGYNLDAIKNGFRPDVVRRRSVRSIWRFWEVLPVTNPAEAVSLGEGQTPLLQCQRRGAFSRFTNLFIKDEAFNPTGSFKARGMSAAVTRAVALGAEAVALPSAGNAAGAATYYAAQAGIACHLFMPEDTPPANIIESIVGGANTYLVNGLISDCGKLVEQACARFGWFDLSTLKEPFRIEGKKTMGYELAFDMADAFGTAQLQLPDVIFYPTGGGTGLIGMWKAFDEMERLGWIGEERPRMVVVQASGCAPIVAAFKAGAEHAEMVYDAFTVAAGLRVPKAIGDFLMLKVLKESNGTAVAVSDEQLLAGVDELARQQGIFACPEAGAAWKAAEQLAEQGWLDRSERIVVFNTGSGLKYNHLFPVPDMPILDHNDPNVLNLVRPSG
jgi:threonine synthase